MSTRQWLALEPTGDEHHWRLPLGPRVLTHAGALHGGAGLAAMVDAAQRATGRPLVWGTAQYLRHAGPAGDADIEITVELAGHHTSQARGTMQVDGVEVLSVVTAHGRREYPRDAVWGSPPVVPAAAQCATWPLPAGGAETLLDHFDLRHASGRSAAEVDGNPGSGRTALWCRGPGMPRAVDALDAAVLGDFVMLALSDALGSPTTANSLDNTIRMVARPMTEWVLIDVTVDAAADGFGHVHARLWADDGTLIALTSQTLVLRGARPDGRSTRSTRRIAGSPER